MESPTPTEEKIINKKDNSRISSKACCTAWIAIGLLLITWLVSGIGLGLFWLRYQNQISQYPIQLSKMGNQLSANQNNIEQLQNHLTQLQNFIQQKLPSKEDENIVLANASQLIHLAHYNLTYLYNIDSALAALSLANKQLATITNPDTRLTDLRHLLSTSIVALQALPHFDLANNLSQLHALQCQILELPPLALTIRSTPKINPTINTETTWTRAIQDSLTNFRQLIVIRHLNKPIKPLLSKERQQYIQLNLQLLIEQAQWALLHYEPAVYQASLQQAEKIIQANFDANYVTTQAILQNIEQLKKIQLSPLPDLTPLLQSITSIEKTTNPTPSTIATSNANAKEPS